MWITTEICRDIYSHLFLVYLMGIFLQLASAYIIAVLQETYYVYAPFFTLL